MEISGIKNSIEEIIWRCKGEIMMEVGLYQMQMWTGS